MSNETMDEERNINHEAPVHDQESPTNYTVCCSGFTNDVTEDLIKETFSQYGTIHDIRVIKDKGCAFIKFTTKESATRAIEATNNNGINGSIVQSFWENENRDSNSVGLNANQQIKQTDEVQPVAAGGNQIESPQNNLIVGAETVGCPYPGPVLYSEPTLFQSAAIPVVAAAASMKNALGEAATASASAVAAMQSIGATGIVLGSTGVTAGVSAVGSAVGGAASRLFRSFRGTE